MPTRKADETAFDERAPQKPARGERTQERGPDDPSPDEVDPLAPGRSIVDPDLDEAVEPNEPA
jgi:hypothetical protein